MAFITTIAGQPSPLSKGEPSRVIDETIWPANPIYEMFRQWFDVEINSMVIDLCEYRFQVEEL